MSHITTIQTEVRDPAVVAAACTRLQLPAPGPPTVNPFSGEVAGLTVELPGWRYPVVCQTEASQLHYDNFHGHWGDESQLDRFKQAYAAEMGHRQPPRRGGR